MTCRKHEPKPLFAKPDPKTQPDLALAYILRGHDRRIVCSACGLTGYATAFDRVRWLTPGTVGYRDRERWLARAAEWNAKVEGAA